jgi:acyl carrier protein
MKQRDFLKHIDEVLDVPSGTVRGDEALSEIEGWDSLAVVGFIAVVNQHLGVTLSAKSVQQATTMPALLALIPQEKLQP